MNPTSSHRHFRNTTSTIASATALLAGLAMVAMAPAAHAQSVSVSTGSAPQQIDTSSVSTVTVTSGTNATVLPNGQQWAIPSGSVGLYYNSNLLSIAPASSPFGGTTQGAQIVTQAGSTLTFIGNQTIGWGPWVAMDGMIRASGDVVFEGGTQNIIGANSFLGNLTIKTGAQLYNGESWGAPATLTFGANSNVSLESGAYWYINQGNSTSTINGALSAADSTAVIDLTSGTMVVNGKNTSASPFRGTLNLAPGASLVVGDASHASAIFGDPAHTDGSGLTLNITRSATGASALLQGYGTIYGTVNNPSGIVQPGGTAGTLGTLTVSKYTQGATGTLKVEVSPTGASKLNVLGSATVGGTLSIVVDAGKYSNGVYTVLSAQSISGSFSSIVTSGNTAGAIVGLQVTPTSYSLVTESTETTQIIPHLAAANRDHIKVFTGALFDAIATTSTSFGAPVAPHGHGISLWLAPLGQHSTVRNGDTGYSLDAGGIMGGVEKALPWNGKLGVAVGYTSSTLNARSVTARARTDTLDIAAYGGVELENARIDFVGFYNSYDATSTRTLDSYGAATAKPKGTAYGAALQISHGIYNNTVVPFLRGTYAYNNQQQAVETGAGALALRFDQLRLNSVVADVGVKIHPLASVGKIGLRPEITLAVEHDFSNPGEHVTGQFSTISGSPFSYVWAGNTQAAGVGSLGLVARLPSGIELFGQVDGRFTAHQESGSASAGVRYRF